MAGNSGTPLAKKLGIQEGSKLYVVQPPKDYLKVIAPVPNGVKVASRMSGDIDIVHVFSAQKSQLLQALRVCLDKLKPNGAIWVSWPKKASKVTTDITEDTIRAIALPMGLVDIKVCAVDEVWSGLKLVIRKENRKPAAVARARTKSARK